jgi:hypothetical protein
MSSIFGDVRPCIWVVAAARTSEPAFTVFISGTPRREVHNLLDDGLPLWETLTEEMDLHCLKLHELDAPITGTVK